jgi:hypothetical protein
VTPVPPRLGPSNGAAAPLVHRHRDGRRPIGLRPDRMLYVSIGTCNTCDETNPDHAALLSATLDGRERTVFARGLEEIVEAEAAVGAESIPSGHLWCWRSKAL